MSDVDKLGRLIQINRTSSTSGKRRTTLTCTFRKNVNAGEKMHRRAGVKKHHGRRHSAATLNSAFQFD